MAEAIEGEMVNEDEVSAWPQAKLASDLPTPNNLPDVIGLGGLEVERFATEMLGQAGINVEMLGGR